MQAAGETIGLIVEFAAGVQPREDQLDAADLLLRMHIDRHATAVIDNLERTILI